MTKDKPKRIKPAIYISKSPDIINSDRLFMYAVGKLWNDGKQKEAFKLIKGFGKQLNDKDIMKLVQRYIDIQL